MKILCVGDVCGSIGCKALRRFLPQLKAEHGVDFVIVNGENSADGNGLTAQSAAHIFTSGANVITGGNHSFRRKEELLVYEQNSLILRPHNIPEQTMGSGLAIVDCGRVSVAVINLSGVIYLDALKATSPFAAADELIQKAKNLGANIIVVDFHAEATSEKRALGLYLDGKVSAVFGTHTHIQTADEQILPHGTGYITDVGMTGPKNSILGVKSEIIISRLKDKTCDKFVLADGECILNGVIFTVDEKSGQTVQVERVLAEE